MEVVRFILKCLMSIISGSVVCTDFCCLYNTLGVSRLKHYKINHSKLFTQKLSYIDGIENFWNEVRIHMRKFNKNTRTTL